MRGGVVGRLAGPDPISMAMRQIWQHFGKSSLDSRNRSCYFGDLDGYSPCAAGSSMVKKLTTRSRDLVAENIAKLAALFPGCVTEVAGADSEPRKSIDFDLLRQELSDVAVEGPRERYQLDWPGKRRALLAANTPINKTLRPRREQSVDFDATKNLFIEGDNLDVLKLLQNTYLGKVKMIYIDPPYNTGKDFIYKDKFAISNGEWKMVNSDYAGNGDRLTQNTETNGRFHSDWLSMMYPRLRLARNLLKDDGVIFISADDNEIHNLRHLCDETFGEDNFIGMVVVKSNPAGRDYGGIARTHDYLLCYSKTDAAAIGNIGAPDKKFPYKDDLGGFEARELRNRNIAFNAGNRKNLFYPFYLDPKSEDESGFFQLSLAEKPGWVEVLPKKSQGVQTVWRWGKEKSQQNLNVNVVGKGNRNGGYQIVEKYREASKMARSIWDDNEVSTQKGTLLVKNLLDAKVFDFPKTVGMIRRIVEMASGDDDIVLDFFAGSATTAHAVMQLNAEDGGRRRFIMAQFPERCDEDSKAFKAGYKTIAEIGRERIRRAGEKLKAANGITAPDLDIGFRALQVDSTNMKDVYRAAEELRQDEMHLLVENIKDDRSAEDLLFQVFLDYGIDLDSPIVRETIQGREVFFVNDGELAACFAGNGEVDADFCKEIIQREPLRVVFRDAGFEDSNAMTNVVKLFDVLARNVKLEII